MYIKIGAKRKVDPRDYWREHGATQNSYSVTPEADYSAQNSNDEQLLEDNTAPPSPHRGTQRAANDLTAMVAERDRHPAHTARQQRAYATNDSPQVPVEHGDYADEYNPHLRRNSDRTQSHNHSGGYVRMQTHQNEWASAAAAAPRSPGLRGSKNGGRARDDPGTKAGGANDLAQGAPIESGTVPGLEGVSYTTTSYTGNGQPQQHTAAQSRLSTQQRLETHANQPVPQQLNGEEGTAPEDVQKHRGSKQHNQQLMSWQQQQWAEQDQRDRQQQPHVRNDQGVVYSGFPGRPDAPDQRQLQQQAFNPPHHIQYSQPSGDNARFKIANLPPGEREEAMDQHNRKLAQQAELQASWAAQRAEAESRKGQEGTSRRW